MASNTASTPQAIPVDQAEKFVLTMGDRNLSTKLAQCLNANLVADFTLTSAQVLTLNSVPTTILKAVALTNTVGNDTTKVTTVGVNPGYVVQIDKVVAWSQAGTAYSAVALLIQVGTTTQATFATTALTSVGGNVMSVADCGAGQLIGPVPVTNALTVIATAASDPTTGTFPISLRIFYTLIPVNF